MTNSPPPSLRSLMLGLLVAASGCTLHAASLNAKPQIALANKGQSLALDLAPAVTDSFKIKSNVASGRVDGWRSALTVGFTNGFKHAFAINAPKANLTLQLQQTDVRLIPAATKDNDRNVAARVSIRYKATLNDGGKITELRGEGVSEPGDTFGVIFKKAVERMYEDISIKAFTPSEHAAPAVPFQQ